MLSKIILFASAATLLYTAAAVAQDNQPIIKPPAGQEAGEAPSVKQQDMGGAQGQAGDAQSTKRRLQSSDTAQDTQENMNAQPDQGTESTAQGDEGTVKKKLRNTDQAQQGDEGQGQVKKKAQQAQEDQADTKKKKADQAQQGEEGTTVKKRAQQQQSDELTTGSTSKAVDITPEKRTVIRERIVTKNVTRVDRDDIDIDINIGVAVPSTIHLTPLPTTVVEVVPEYEGYLYFVLADGTIVIVEPSSMQIVYMLTA